MKQWRTFAALALLAIAATLASSLVGGRASSSYPEIMGYENACATAAGGWPFPYLVDFPALSPAGSVWLIGGLLGMDKFRYPQLAGSFLFWLGAGSLACLLIRRRRSGRAPPPG